jgi:subfamily B ATP-binding cassette protein HlyB/CyaB
MRALLYVVQQIGRPLSEADARGLAGLTDERLDEQGFLAAGARLGLRASAVDLAAASLDDLPTPFAVVDGEESAHVVAAGRGGIWTVLDVVEGRVWQMTSADIEALSARAGVAQVSTGGRPGGTRPLTTMRPVIANSP